MPLILGGIANMIFTKTNFYRKYKKPIDCNKVLSDNKRLFGDNKTWIGFISMIIFCVMSQVFWGIVCNVFSLNKMNDLYITQNNNFLFNLLYGLLFGFVYMIFELPNSFIKRRLDIADGKTATGLKGIVFFIIDQIDSLIGVMFLIYVFANITFLKYLLYILVGAFTHILINSILYLLKVRKNL